MVILVSQACSLTGSTQASWAREPQRRSRLGLGLFSAGGKVTVSDRCSKENVKMAFLESVKLSHSLPQLFFQAPSNLRQYNNSMQWKRQDGGDPTGTYSAGRAW